MPHGGFVLPVWAMPDPRTSTGANVGRTTVAGRHRAQCSSVISRVAACVPMLLYALRQQRIWVAERVTESLCNARTQSECSQYVSPLRTRRVAQRAQDCGHPAHLSLAVRRVCADSRQRTSEGRLTLSGPSNRESILSHICPRCKKRPAGTADRT